MAEAETAKRIISDIGKRLTAQKICPNKDLLVKLLKQASSAFAGLQQCASLELVIKPLSDSLVKHRLLQHRDKDVRLLVALCICEIIRVLAPDPGFSDAVFRDIFKLFLSMFKELADTSSPFLTRRVKLLETVSKLNFCVLMLDTGSEDLVLEMFNVFFSVVREHHPQSLFSAMASIMAMILKEKAKMLKETVCEPLVDVILQNLLKEIKGASPACFRLAVYIIQNFIVELEPFIVRFLTFCISDRDAIDSEVKEFYHDIIFEIFQCAPQILLAVIPSLTQELLTDQVDVRIKAINLLGRLFALPGHNITQEYHHIFIEFLNRFSDKSAEVRLSALSCAKAFYMTNPSGTESLEVLTAIKGRLLDFDDRVRALAVAVVCDLVRFNSKSVPPELLSRAVERLRDKRVSVRKKALQKLLEVYQDYCMKCSGGTMTLSDHFEQIPCKILMLCYDKDCKEFGPQNMELVLADDLFPSLSIEDRTRHWVFLFSLFSPPHIKALNTILSQKKRLQTEMQAYLALRKNEEEIGSLEVEKKIQISFAKMSATFPDPAKAEECFCKLNVVKDDVIFNALMQLLDEVTIKNAQSTRDRFLSKIGDKNPHFAFLQLLSTKCLCNLFSCEHVSCILDHLSRDKFGSKHLGDSAVKLLLTVISSLPSLLRGSEKQFCHLLLEEDIPFNEDLLQMLAKAGPHISIKLSDIYSSLERVCLEGTRSQSKLGVSAIAAFSTSKQSVFSKLCKTLVDSLYNGRNIPSVLQSFGCIAQHSISAFEAHEKEITQYIHENIFQVADVDMPVNLSPFDETSECGILCQLKIFGLKTLVKSFLPHQRAHISQKINKLLDVLLEMLQKGETSDGTISCEFDKAQIRLAAAKSVLRLSRRWDLHISPQIFQFTVLMAKDPLPLIRRSFVEKTHKLFKEHAIPGRYACVFAMAASDSPSDLQEHSLSYMAEFIAEYHKRAQIHQTSEMEGVTDDPVYIMVFLIYVLAHDPSFPADECLDEEIHARFCSPLVTSLQAFLNVSFANGDVNVVNKSISYLQSIFHAIKRAEDAVDSQVTPKLHILADFGTSILNVLRRGSKSASYTPRLVFLPSSLYKVSVTEKRKANTKSLTLCGYSDNITEKLIRCPEGQLYMPASTFPKRGQKRREGSLQSDATRCSKLNLGLSKKVDLLINEMREQSSDPSAHRKELHVSRKQEINAKQKRKVALSSMGLHSEFSVDDEDEKDALGHSKSIYRNEQLLSSCNSATMDSSPSEREFLTDASLEENEAQIAGPSTVNHADLCSTVATAGDKSESLVGQRIRLCSPIDKCYYSGTVDGFNSADGTHKGSSCHNLQLCDHLVHSSVSCQGEMVKAYGCDTSQQKENLPKKERRAFLNKKIPLTVNAKKGESVSVDSRSEVIDVNEDAIVRKTRRQKF